MNRIFGTTLVLFLIFYSASAFSAAGLTLQGRIVRDSKAITASSVTFLVQIRSPGSENCLLFQETHTVNMSASNGLFSLPIGSGTRALASVDGGFSLQRVFANRGSIDLSSVVVNASNTQPCASGTIYSPAATDKRKIVYSFNDGHGSVALGPIDVTYNPMSMYALESESIGGFANGNLLRVENAGVPGTASALSTAQMTELMNIITGASVQYIKPGSAAFTAQPTFAGAPVNPSDLVNKAYVDAAASAGLPNVGTAGTYTKVTTDAQGRVVTGVASLVAADIPNLDAAKITTGTFPDSMIATISTAGKVNGGAITTGTIAGNTVINTTGSITAAGLTTSGTVAANTVSGNALRAYNGALNYVELSAPVATSGAVNFKLPSADGTIGQVLKTDGAGNWGWVSPSAGAVTAVTATAPVVSSGGTAPVISLNTGNGLTVSATNLVIDAGLGANKIPQVGGSALGANGVVVANGTGTALASLNCTSGQVVKFDVSGFAVCGADGGGAGDISNGGNTTGAAVTIGTNDAQSLAFETNNTTNMTILSSGNVGIGTLAPVGRSESANAAGGNFGTAATPNFLSTAVTGNGLVDSIGRETFGLSISSGGKGTSGGTYGGLFSLVGTNAYYDVASDTIKKSINSSFSGMSYDAGLAMAFIPDSSATQSQRIGFFAGTGVADSNLSEVMTIKSSGNVGIGTTSPGAPLDVKGAIRMSGAVSGYTGFKPAAAAGSTVWELPAADGTNNQVLKTDGAGVLSWTTVSGTGLQPANNLSDVANVATSRSNLGLGTAAVLNAGTGNNNIVQLDGTAKLPAVDGSALTGLTASQIPNLDAAKITSGTLADARMPALTGDVTMAVGTTATSISGLARSKLSSGTNNHVLINDGSGVMSSEANLAVTRGGTGIGSFGNNSVIISNGTGSALSSLNCTIGQVIKFDASGFAVCGTDNSGVGDIVNGGNTTGSTVTVGTNDAQSLDFETNNSTKMTILSNGNVGVGTAAPGNNILSVDAGNVGGRDITLKAGDDGWGTPDNPGDVNLVAGYGYNNGGNINLTTGFNDHFGGYTGSVNVLSSGVVSQVFLDGSGGVATGLDLYRGNSGLTGSGINLNFSAKDASNAKRNLADISAVLTDAAAATLKSDLVINSVHNGAIAEKMRITSNGNVGIGTTNPSQLLTVAGQSSTATISNRVATAAPSFAGYRSNGTLTVPTAPAINDILSQFVGYSYDSGIPGYLYAGGMNVSRDGGAAAPETINSYLTFHTGSGALGVTEKLRIDRSGNVGIGTTSPGAPLDVKGAIRMSGATSGYTGFKPAAAAGSTVWELPAADGTNNQVLKTDGAGVLSWTTVSGTGLQPANNLSDVASVATARSNLGLGTGALITAGTAATLNVGTGNSDIVQLDGTAKLPAVDGSALTNLSAANLTGTIAAARMPALTGDVTMTAGTTTTSINGLARSKLAVGTINHVLINDGSGGAMSSEANLAVIRGGTGAGSFGNNSVIISNGTGSALTSLNCTSSQVVKFDVSGYAICGTDNAGSGDILNGGNTTGSAVTIGTNDVQSLNFETNNATKMTILSDGNVGIGTTNPTNILEVTRPVTSVGNGAGVQISAQSANGMFGAGGSVNINSGNSDSSAAGSINLTTGYGSVSNGSINLNAGAGLINITGGASVSTYWPILKVFNTVTGNAVDQGVGITLATRRNGGTETAAGEIGAILTDISASYKGSLIFKTANSNSPSEKMRIDHLGNVGFGLTAPTALVHMKAGASAAGTAPLKFTSGTNLTTPENGAMEWDGTDLFITSGGTRRTIATSSSGTLGQNVSTINNTGGNISLTPSATNSVIVNQTTASTSSTTGALVVNGGAGIAGALNVAGNIVGANQYGSTAASGNLTLESTSSGTKGYLILTPGATGNVGIGTATPASKLEVNGNIRQTSGQITSAPYNNVAAVAFDFNNGNVQYTSANCQAMTLSNMLDGGTYTVVVKGTTSGTCSFTHAGLTFWYSPAQGATASGSMSTYSFVRVGNDVMVTWISLYQ